MPRLPRVWARPWLKGATPWKKRLLLASHALAALDPEGVVRRGYAVVFKNGRYVPEAQALRAGDAIELHMRGGNVAAEVTDGELHL